MSGKRHRGGALVALKRRERSVRAAEAVRDPSSLPYVLTAREAARLLRVHENDIYDMCARNVLRRVPGLGRRVRVLRDEVLALLRGPGGGVAAVAAAAQAGG